MKNNITISFQSTTIIFLIFLILKLTNTVTWSWWVITAPLWIPYGLVLGIIGICFTIGMSLLVACGIIVGCGWIGFKIHDLIVYK